MAIVNSYKNLIVWQKSVDLVVEIYRLSELLPKSEMYGMTSQMRRAAVSIPANIAEGNARGHRLEYCRFVKIAYASGAELETHLLIAMRLGYISESKIGPIEGSLDEVMRMTNALHKALSAR